MANMEVNRETQDIHHHSVKKNRLSHLLLSSQRLSLQMPKRFPICKQVRRLIKQIRTKKTRNQRMVSSETSNIPNQCLLKPLDGNLQKILRKVKNRLWINNISNLPLFHLRTPKCSKPTLQSSITNFVLEIE